MSSTRADRGHRGSSAGLRLFMALHVGNSGGSRTQPGLWAAGDIRNRPTLASGCPQGLAERRNGGCSVASTRRRFDVPASAGRLSAHCGERSASRLVYRVVAPAFILGETLARRSAHDLVLAGMAQEPLSERESMGMPGAGMPDIVIAPDLSNLPQGAAATQTPTPTSDGTSQSPIALGCLSVSASCCGRSSGGSSSRQACDPSHRFGGVTGVYRAYAASCCVLPRPSVTPVSPSLLPTPGGPCPQHSGTTESSFASLLSWIVRMTSYQILTITSCRCRPGARPTPRLSPQLVQPAVRPLDARDTSENAPYVRSPSWR